MRLLALALVLASAALGQTRTPRIRSNGGLSKRFPNQGGNPVLLQFLPNAISASEECTGTALTATNGTALTFTRGSAAFCTKTDGTLVSLTNNLPRLQGTGLLVEGASTNVALRSAEFENAAWTMTNVTAPSANSTVAPDGTTTAELLTSTVNGGRAETTTAVAIASTSISVSLYVKTTAGTQSMSIILRDTTAGADRCTGTVTATTTYQRVSCSSAAATSGNNHTVRIYPGGVAGTGTVVAWGAQMEALTFPSSYVATAGTTVARSTEVPSFAVPSGMTDSAGCVGATFLVPGHNAAVPQRIIAFDVATSFTPMYLNGATTTGAYDSTNFASSPSAVLAGVATYIASGWSGATQTFYRGGLTTTAGYDGSWPVGSTVYLGANGVNSLFGTISTVKLGRTSGACL